jgi:hypothetical protein
LRPGDRKVFEGDGAEIIYGIIQESYLKEDYAKVVKFWEVYKDKYETKVAKNLYLNFVIADAFLKLGLYKSFDRALVGFKNVEKEEIRTYPIWIERIKNLNLSQLMEELTLNRLVANGNWDEAQVKLTSYPVPFRETINFSFYQGMVNFYQKDYTKAVEEFEKTLIKQNPQNQLTPRQTADLIMSYVESLYQLRDQDRFKTVVKALVQDISSSKSAQLLNITERINYLLIESFAGENQAQWSEIEMMTKAFREKFQKSPYTARISYLYGLSLIKNSKVPEGREVFRFLTEDKQVPSHIKEMCRSELATLELKEKKL